MSIPEKKYLWNGRDVIFSRGEPSPLATNYFTNSNYNETTAYMNTNRHIYEGTESTESITIFPEITEIPYFIPNHQPNDADKQYFENFKSPFGFYGNGIIHPLYRNPMVILDFGDWDYDYDYSIENIWVNHVKLSNLDVPERANKCIIPIPLQDINNIRDDEFIHIYLKYKGGIIAEQFRFDVPNLKRDNKHLISDATVLFGNHAHKYTRYKIIKTTSNTPIQSIVLKKPNECVDNPKFERFLTNSLKIVNGQQNIEIEGVETSTDGDAIIYFHGKKSGESCVSIQYECKKDVITDWHLEGVDE